MFSGLAVVLLLQAAAPAQHAVLVVEPRGALPTLGAALDRAHAGDRIVVRAGVYREPTVRVRERVEIAGEGWPVLDGEGARELLVIAADDVTVRGMVFTHTGVSDLQDRAAVRAANVHACRVEGNRFRDNLFAVYLERTAGCVVRDNDIEGNGTSQSSSGNGIHLWYARGTLIEHNRVRGQRDGIYFEFSTGGVVRDNVSERNLRYGLHFMFSDSCRYERNQFVENASGVAVMFSHHVAMTANRFSHNWGPAAYGLLLKEIYDGEIRDNDFDGNSTGIYLEGSGRLDIRDNRFTSNGWAAKVMADAQDNRFRGNQFEANAFDVGTNSRTNTTTFDGNWWDAYRGYDLNHDGVGDVPFRPVRLFALVVGVHPAALLLLRSPAVSMLDAAERVLPVLTPETLVDAHPLMRPPR
jgi:nitrous oxidase accessory protein